MVIEVDGLHRRLSGEAAEVQVSSSGQQRPFTYASEERTSAGEDLVSQKHQTEVQHGRYCRFSWRAF